MGRKHNRKVGPAALFRSGRTLAAKAGYVMQVCSRCSGSTIDPEMPDCRCDVCGGTGEEEVPAGGHWVEQ